MSYVWHVCATHVSRWCRVLCVLHACVTPVLHVCRVCVMRRPCTCHVCRTRVLCMPCVRHACVMCVLCVFHACWGWGLSVGFWGDRIVPGGAGWCLGGNSAGLGGTLGLGGITEVWGHTGFWGGSLWGSHWGLLRGGAVLFGGQMLRCWGFTAEFGSLRGWGGAAVFEGLTVGLGGSYWGVRFAVGFGGVTVEVWRGHCCNLGGVGGVTAGFEGAHIGISASVGFVGFPLFGGTRWAFGVTLGFEGVTFGVTLGFPPPDLWAAPRRALPGADVHLCEPRPRGERS